MNRIVQLVRRSGYLSSAVALVALWAFVNLTLLGHSASAAQITSRKLQLSSSAIGSVSTATPGDGGNGQKAKHTVSFTLGTSGATVGSVAIMYCTSPIPQTACTSGTATTGDESNLTNASVSVSGLAGTGWALDTTTTDPTITNYGTCNGGGTVRSNCVLLKASAGAANSGTPAVTIGYGGQSASYVTNPTTTNTTFYARIVLFSDTGYTTVVDNGSVANSTATQIAITAKVQETLNFSAGTTVTAPGTSCTAFSDSGALKLGDTNGVLSFTTAYDAHSYFRVSTNANNGTVIYYSGATLANTTGSGTIAAMGTTQPTPTTAVASAVGTAQFGLALDSSDTQSGSGYSFTTLTGTSPYTGGSGTITNGGTATFAFAPSSTTTPVQIASAAAPIVCDTGSVRYLGNISTTIPPGIYATTITYMALPTY